MRGVRDFGTALTAGLISIALTLGALSISLVGFTPQEAPTPTQPLFSSPIPITVTNTFPPTLTLQVAVDTPTWTATNTVSVVVSCSVPSGWAATLVQTGDTLDVVAARYGTNKEILKSGNCLISESLIPGTILYVPGVSTSTVVVCNSGAAGWIRNYIVRSGDTFFNIASRYGTNANLIKSVNCHSSDLIYPGDVLWVPNVPTRTPTFTPLPGITYTSAPYLTEPFTQTVLPFTFTPIPTQTSLPTLTPTATRTVTPIPTETASPTTSSSP